MSDALLMMKQGNVLILKIHTKLCLKKKEKKRKDELIIL